MDFYQILKGNAFVIEYKEQRRSKEQKSKLEKLEKAGTAESDGNMCSVELGSKQLSLIFNMLHFIKSFDKLKLTKGK